MGVKVTCIVCMLISFATVSPTIFLFFTEQLQVLYGYTVKQKSYSTRNIDEVIN